MVSDAILSKDISLAQSDCAFLKLTQKIVCKLTHLQISYFKGRVIKDEALYKTWGSRFANSALNSFIVIPFSSDEEPYFDFINFEGRSVHSLSDTEEKIFGCLIDSLR